MLKKEKRGIFMKKFLSVFLAVVMCLSFVACGKGNSDTLDKNDNSNYIGVWETEHIRLTINKGGVGEYQFKTEDGKYNLEWEVSDEVLITRINFMGTEYKSTLELNDDASVLSIIQNGFPKFIDGETEFVKQS